jgi:hypothetical protein
VLALARVNSDVMSLFRIKGEMRLFVHSLAVILALLFAAALTSQAQCNRIDRKTPDFFVTYERVVTETKAPEGKGYRTQALLRLQNNTNCTIILPSNDEGPSPQLRKLLHRDQTLKRTDALTDGQQLALVYNLNNERGANGTILVSYGCLVYERSLAAGESVLFSVPIIHFKKGADVAVQFKYASEDQHVSLLGGDFGHYVFFRNDSLPQEIARR